MALFAKGSRLALELARMDSLWAWAAPLLGLMVGIPKIIYVFNRVCRRNLERIAALQQPRPWQFFRPLFFLALAAMIATGVLLSHLAFESFALLVFVVALDFSLATALLGSLPVFIAHQAGS